MRRVSGTYSAQISTDGVTWSDMTAYENNAGTGAVSAYFLIYNTTGNTQTINFKNLKVYPI